MPSLVPFPESFIAADTFSRNETNHLDGVDRAAHRAMDNIVLHAVAISIELLLKSYLLRVATDDRWNRQHIGHDLDYAARYAEIAGLALPPQLQSVIAQLHPHFQRGGVARNPSRKWPPGFSLRACEVARQLAEKIGEHEHCGDNHSS